MKDFLICLLVFSILATSLAYAADFSGFEEVLRCDVKICDQDPREDGSIVIFRNPEPAPKENISKFIAEIHILSESPIGNSFQAKQISYGNAEESIKDLDGLYRTAPDEYETLKAHAEITNAPWEEIKFIHVIRIMPILDGIFASIFVHMDSKGNILHKTGTLGFMPIECEPDAKYDPEGDRILSKLEALF